MAGKKANYTFDSIPLNSLKHANINVNTADTVPKIDTCLQTQRLV